MHIVSLLLNDTVITTASDLLTRKKTKSELELNQ